MRHILIFSLAAILSAINSFAQGDDDSDDQTSGSITVNIDLYRLEPACTVRKTEDLDFGTLQAPGSGEEDRIATFSPLSDGGTFSYKDRSDNDLTSSASGGMRTIGTVTARMENFGWNVSVEFIYPDSDRSYLSRCSGMEDGEGPCRIGWVPVIAGSDVPSGDDWIELGPRFRLNTNPNYRYYQIGGDLTVPAGTPEGKYTSTVRVMITCS